MPEQRQDPRLQQILDDRAKPVKANLGMSTKDLIISFEAFKADVEARLTALEQRPEVSLPQPIQGESDPPVQ
jgi:hypothetical protein